MTKIKALISDSDGTLVNTLYLIRHGQYEAAVEYLIEIGIPRRDIPVYETYRSFINKSVGGNTRETFEATIQLLFKKKHQEHLEKINFDKVDEKLHPIQDRLAPLYVHPFHGLTEFFAWLGKSDIGLGIFTSGDSHQIVRHYGIALPMLGYTDLYKNTLVTNQEKLNALIQRVKAVYGIKKFAITTTEDVTKTKPDPEGILKTLDKLGFQPDEILVIGDHSVDMRAAKAAGLHTIGVTHGFGTPTELKEAGAMRVVKNLSAVSKVVEDHNSGKSPLF